jgi:hypothetical protein
MGFEVGRRRGKYWEDAQELNDLIYKFPFHTTGKNEKDFETGFATTLMVSKDNFDSDVITQIDKTTTVQSVYCFGKKHRPDMALDENGIAIELKFVNYAGLKDAIGQGYLYRLRYKFVFLVLIISEERQSIYHDLNNKQEKDLEDTLRHLADNMNIFTYIVPAFDTSKTPGIKKVISFFD